MTIIQTEITSLSLTDRDTPDPQSDLHAEMAAAEQLDRPALFLSTACRPACAAGSTTDRSFWLCVTPRGPKTIVCTLICSLYVTPAPVRVLNWLSSFSGFNHSAATIVGFFFNVLLFFLMLAMYVSYIKDSIRCSGLMGNSIATFPPL